MRFIAILIIAFLSAPAQAGVLWETNFENVQNWDSGRPAKGNSLGYGWISTWKSYNSGNPTYPGAKNSDNSFLCDIWRLGATEFSTNVTSGYVVGNGYGRNYSRGLIYNVEVTGQGSKWSGGMPIGVYLGQNTTYSDIYVGFWLRYDPAFAWRDDGLPKDGTNTAFQKLMKIARYNGYFGDGGNPEYYVAPSGGGKNFPVWVPDFYSNISPTPSSIEYMNSDRYAPNYSAQETAAENYGAFQQYYPNGKLSWPADGEWHHYEFRAKMNSAPGVADGLSQIWLDGGLKWSKPSVPWVLATVELSGSPSGSYATFQQWTGAVSGAVAKGMIAPYTSGGHTYIDVQWVSGGTAFTPGETITATGGATATVVGSAMMPGGDTTNGWNNITVLDNLFITSHSIGNEVVYFMALDDVVVSTSYIGPSYVPGGLASGRYKLPGNLQLIDSLGQRRFLVK